MTTVREDHVFLNCPFDEEYRPFFDAAVFTIYDAGFIARCSREVSDAARNRLAILMDIISECRYGFHDISRTETNPAGLPRFNMPFELGLFLACKRFGGRAQRAKSCLIMDREPYRYQQYLSDIAGQDILAHRNQPRELVRGIRDWLRTASGRTNIPGGSSIWQRFERFQNDLPSIYGKLNITPRDATFADYSHIALEWLKLNTLP